MIVPKTKMDGARATPIESPGHRPLVRPLPHPFRLLPAGELMDCMIWDPFPAGGFRGKVPLEVLSF